MSELDFTRGSAYYQNKSKLDSDYIGFRIDGVHSFDLGINRVSNNNRYSDPVFADFTNDTQRAPEDGTQFFGSQFINKPISINIAYDSMTRQQMNKLRQLTGNRKVHEIIFDEYPQILWRAAVNASPELEYVAFDGVDEKGNKIEILKGEGTLSFICYYQFGIDTEVFEMEIGGDESNYVGEEKDFQKYENFIRAIPIWKYPIRFYDFEYDLNEDGNIKRISFSTDRFSERLIMPFREEDFKYYVLIFDGKEINFYVNEIDSDIEKDLYDGTKWRFVADNLRLNNSFIRLFDDIKQSISEKGYCFNKKHYLKAPLQWNPYDTKGYADKNIPVYNFGDVACDYQVIIEGYKEGSGFKSINEKGETVYYDNIVVVNELTTFDEWRNDYKEYSRARLFEFKDIALKNGEDAILIDTKTRLVYGLSNGKKTGSIYNKYLIRENWYKLQCDSVSAIQGGRSFFRVAAPQRIDYDGTPLGNSDIEKYKVRFSPWYL